MPLRRLVIAAVSGLMLAVFATESTVSARQDDDFPSLSSLPSPARQSETINLRVWWPDILYSENAATTLENQFDSFRSAYVTVSLDLRYHEYQPIDTMHRLTLTRDVAPGALPDLTLMRYEEIVTAVNRGLLQPVEGLLPPSVFNDLADNILALGQIGNEFYGIPYLLSVDHMLYTGAVPTPPRDFTDFLGQDTPLLFAARPTSGQTINDMLLIQYLAEGGYFVDQQNNPALNEEAMLTVLDFYNAANQRDSFSPTLQEALQFQTPTDYELQVSADSPVLALIDSSDYLRNRNRLPKEAQITPPLTADGQPFTLLDGWMWVLLTNDPARQIQARNFLTWMMNSDNLTDTALALDMLPSQQRALRVIAEDNNLTLLSNLVSVAYFLPPDQRQNAAALALQAAFESVLQGTRPDAAAETALASLRN
ncbi:MAG: extracellular solute-binding protein [Chloroflexi bacterium]|nr:extracellular solute-binding protein [Chloroflexota bacterium]